MKQEKAVAGNTFTKSDRNRFISGFDFSNFDPFISEGIYIKKRKKCILAQRIS